MSITKDKIQLSIEINGQKAGKTQKDLIDSARTLKNEMKALAPASDAFIKKSQELKKVNNVLAEIRDSTRGTTLALEKTTGVLGKAKVAAIAFVGALSIQRAAQFFVQGFKDIVNASANFQKAMNEVKAVSDVTGEQFDALKAKAKELGGSTSKSATEAAEGLKFLALAGFSVEDQLAAIEPVLRLSEAGGIDLALAADLATDSMSALGLSADELGPYLDVVANTSTKSNTSIAQLNEAMIAVGGQFKNLNTPVTEANALLGIMANRGIKGAEAGNSLNSILINLTSGAGQAGTAMEQLGISAFDTEGNFKGTDVVLKELNAKFATMTQEQSTTYKAMIGGKTQITALNALLSGMSEEFDGLNSSLENSDGKLNDVAKTMQEGFIGTVTQMKSALEGLFIQIGDYLLPVLTSMVAGLTFMINALRELPKFIKENRVLLASLVTALIGLNFQLLTANALSLKKIIIDKATLIWEAAKAKAFNKSAFSMKGLNDAMKANPIGLIITAVSLLVAGFKILYNNSETVRKGVDKLTDAFKLIGPVFAGIKAALVQRFKNIAAGFTILINGIKIGFLEAQKFITIDSNKRAQLQKEIDDLKKLSKDAADSGKFIGKAFKEAFDKALVEQKSSDAAKKELEARRKVENADNEDGTPSTFNPVIPTEETTTTTGTATSTTPDKSKTSKKATGKKSSATSGSLGSIEALSLNILNKSLEERLEALNNGLDKELDEVEKNFLLKLFTEEEYRIKSLQAEVDFYDKKLVALEEAGKKDTEQYRDIELQKLRSQEKISEERIKIAERESNIKAQINKSVEQAARSALDVGIELLSQDEAARKKNASAIKAFEIGKVTVDGVKEIQGYFAGYASLGPLGQAAAIAQSALAAVRTGVAIKKIGSQKFAGGGFTGSGYGMPDTTGFKVAGVVHQDEYVAPKHQIERYPWLFNMLDQERIRGFATGGFTTVDTTPTNIPDIAPGQSAAQDLSEFKEAVSMFTRALQGGLKVRASVVHSDIEAADNEINSIRQKASF